MMPVAEVVPAAAAAAASAEAAKLPGAEVAPEPAEAPAVAESPEVPAAVEAASPAAAETVAPAAPAPAAAEPVASAALEPASAAVAEPVFLAPASKAAPAMAPPSAVPAPAAAVQPEPAAETATAAEEEIDDIVPMVSYEDTEERRSCFSKDGRWIIPQREQFPSVFCAVRVRVRLEMLDPSRSAHDLQKQAIDEVLRIGFGLGKALVRWDDARDTTLVALVSASTREVVAALNGSLPAGSGRGSKYKDDVQGVVASVMDVTETSDDMDPTRIMSIARCLKEGGQSDALVFELPQQWIIPDPDFRAKTASIGLYPGSFWMGFLKSWGPVATAEVFFRTAPKSMEPRVHLVVKYKDRECLKMCFTFLFDRYLVHPKQENELRPPWCRMTSFEDFKNKALAKAGAPKSAAKAKGKAVGKARVGKAASVAGLSAAALQPLHLQPGLRTDMAPAPAKAVSHAAAKAAAAARASQAKAQPVAPAPRPPPPAPAMPSLTAGSAKRPRLAEAYMPTAGAAQAAQSSKAPPPSAAPAAEEHGRQMTPAEAMSGMTGRQLEAFKMVMSRMERLERENQELMQILLQMQSLLQQQQQRNARLTQMAGFSASGTDQALQTSAAAASASAAASAASARSAAAAAPGSAAASAVAAPRPPGTAAPGVPPSLGRGAAALPPQQVPPMQKRQAAPAIGAGRGDEEQHYAAAAAGDADAPWKSQRKRARRAPREDGADGTAAGAAASAASTVSAGLAAYHNALLGR